MSRIRLYVEEDSMSRALVRTLRARGVDVITALNTGMIQRPDEEHLSCAASQGRVPYTFNLADFYRLHAAWSARGVSHAGLILAHQQRYSVGEQARRLLRLLASRSAEEMRNRVEFLSHWG